MRRLTQCLILLGTSTLLLTASATATRAQVSFTGNYTQNFDSLASSGTSNTWTDNSTLAGWYSNRTIYLAGTGTNNTGGLYSFGTTSERALGSIGSNSTNTIFYGVQLLNTSGSTIDTLNVSYTGEEWRDGGNATPVAQTLTFGYLNNGNSNANVVTSGGYTGASGLNFTSPTFTTTAGALDGNAAANRLNLSLSLTGLNWQSGQYLWLRWQDINDTGNDHALAIDDLTLSLPAVTPPVSTITPEPGSLALAATGLLSVLGLAVRRRNAR